MAHEQPTDTFRASVVAKIAAWKAVLDSYDAAVALDGRLGEAAVNGRQDQHGAIGDAKPIDLPVGIFRDKSVPEAIQIYLGAGRRKQTNKEIASGLQRGGIATTSKSFEATVATALGRLKDDGTVLRFPDGWDLAASYPENLRNRLHKDAKTAKPKPKEKKARATRAAKTPTAPRKEDKTALILKMISESSGTTVRDLIAGLRLLGVDASADYVRVVARRLVTRGRIQSRDGKYYAAE